MKTNKLILSILTGTLILTSATALLDNSHFVEAKRQNNRTKVVQSQEKKVIKREYLSKDETKKIIDTMLNDGIITKEKQQELYSMLEDRSFGGWFWVEYFSDGAKDIYIPGWFIASNAVALGAVRGVAAGVQKGISLISKSRAVGALAIGNLAVSSYAWETIKNGLVLYMVNPRQKLVCAGGNCFYDTIYDFHHMRIDY